MLNLKVFNTDVAEFIEPLNKQAQSNLGIPADLMPTSLNISHREILECNANTEALQRIVDACGGIDNYRRMKRALRLVQ